MFVRGKIDTNTMIHGLIAERLFLVCGSLSIYCCVPYCYCRCIISSDGVWDVCTVREAASIVKGIADPLKASKLLAETARQRREDRHIKIDDITVVVVDFNYASPLRPPAPTGCGCTIA